MSHDCCAHDKTFDGSDPAFLRILWIIITLNGGMFVTEMIAGHEAGSQSLLADALDFAADTLTYSISLWAIGRPQSVRSTAALFKGYSLFTMALYVVGSTLYKIMCHATPVAETMGLVAILAFAANVISVLLLYKWRNGDANIRSVWLCSRNDAIGNVAVLLAAIGVFGTGTAWPDLIVAGLMAGLFLRGSWQIVKHATAERRSA